MYDDFGWNGLGYGVGMKNMITMPLSDLIDGYNLNNPNASIREKIEHARTRLFDFDYPTLNEEERVRFETNFIRYFYTHEILYETEGRFKFELESWLLLNMPYWNKLLKSQIWEGMIENPLANYDLKETSITEQIADKTSEENKQANGELTRTGNDAYTDSRTEAVAKNNTLTGSTTESEEGTSNKNNEETSALNTVVARDNTETTNVSEVGSSDSNTIASTNTDNFERDLQEDKPQTRLQITPNSDGTGAIEYASAVTENKKIGIESNNVNEAIEHDKTTTGSNVLTGSENQDTTGTTSSSETTDNEISRTGSQSQTEVGSENLTATGNQNKNSNYLDLNISSEKIEGVENENIRTESTVTRVGAIGVARYDELLNGYRDIFKNYDKMILDAMHPELFMLVY